MIMQKENNNPKKPFAFTLRAFKEAFYTKQNKVQHTTLITVHDSFFTNISAMLL